MRGRRPRFGSMICSGATPFSTQSTSCGNAFGTAQCPAAGRAEQAIELLHVLEVRLRCPAIVRPLPVVVDHASRHDELVVAANQRQQLAAALLELLEIAEGIGDVRDVARAVLRDFGYSSTDTVFQSNVRSCSSQ